MPKRKKKRAYFKLGGRSIRPGERAKVYLPVVNLYTNTPIALPVHVLHGREPGPVTFLSAALHGDEINGVEIIRRVLKTRELNKLRGTLLAVPIVNVIAFIHQSRYLPDRRDLNRNFPGSKTGSLAARLAGMFVREVVDRSQYGIDLHTGAIHRPNMPQVRADLDDPETRRLARAFGVPVLLNLPPTAGTLREYTTKKDIPVLLYEASEALRFDEVAIRIGVQGVLNVLYALKMLPSRTDRQADRVKPVIAKSSVWARSPTSGILRARVDLGSEVVKGQSLGVISDPFSETEARIVSPTKGVIIGRLNLPLVHEGDALFHIARVKEPKAVAREVDRVRSSTASARRGPSGELPVR